MDRESLAAETAATASELREQLSLMAAASQMLERTADAREIRYLAALNQSICRMLRTVGRMELAHRLTDENEIRAFPNLMDLGPWTAELARCAHGVLALAGVDLEWEVPDSLLLNGDAGLLSSMVLGMLEAAACAGRQVKLTVVQQEDKAHISAACSGEPLALPKVPACVEPDGEDMDTAMIHLIAQLHGGTLVSCLDGGVLRSLTAILPQRLDLPAGRLQSPHVEPAQGGFDPVLVAFSHLLPATAFQPGME